jgi:hypothetical protein
MQKVFTDDGQGGGYIPDAEVRKMQNPPSEMAELFADEDFENWKGLERSQTKELFDEVFDYLNITRLKTPFQLHTEKIDIQDVLIDMTQKNGLVNTLVLNTGKVIGLSYRARSDMQALITTLAILRYRADEESLPQDLNALVEAGYLKELYEDPFSGKPVNYKRIKDNFVLYSNGVDCDDDNATHDKGWGSKGDGDYVFWPVSSK